MRHMDFATSGSESPPTMKKSDNKYELSLAGPPGGGPLGGGPPGALNSNFNNNEYQFSSAGGAGGGGHGLRHSRSVNGVHRSSSGSFGLKELEAARDWSHDQPAVVGIKDLGTPC